MQLDSNEFVDFKIHLGLRPFHDVDNGLKIDIRNMNFWYGTKHALKDVSLRIYDREVTAFIGPSGCGKTTLPCLSPKLRLPPEKARETNGMKRSAATCFGAGSLIDASTNSCSSPDLGGIGMPRCCAASTAATIWCPEKV